MERLNSGDIVLLAPTTGGKLAGFARARVSYHRQKNLLDLDILDVYYDAGLYEIMKGVSPIGWSRGSMFKGKEINTRLNSKYKREVMTGLFEGTKKW